MLRRILVLASLVGLASITSILALSCKNTGDASGEGGAPAPKLICKINNQCLVCPDEAAMKKCIINPATSGCRAGTATECSQ